jgi:hypothetical protein
MAKSKYAEAARIFPNVYAYAMISLLNRFPLFSAVKGLEKMLDDRAAEVTYDAIDALLHANQIQLDVTQTEADEEFSFLLSYVSEKIDFAYVDEQVKTSSNILILKGEILRCQSR